MTTPLLSCTRADHYTPKVYVEAARRVLGAIDLDPASDALANKTVQATTFFEKAGAQRPWHGRVYVNPPGDRRGRNVVEFWRAANAHALWGGPDASVVWAGYTLNSLARLWNLEPLRDGVPCPAPLDWPIVIIGKGAPATSSGGRICWIQGQTGTPGKQPTHANYFSLLSREPDVRRRFREVFGAWGQYSDNLV